MSSLQEKNIILGITGSIAAYKSATLCRLLIKAGCNVKVIMTESAAEFITPLSLSTLSKNEVVSAIATEDNWSNHVELGLWADAFLIAPATANTMGKMVSGLADNMLVATYLSAKCPVFVAPAMDLDMWKHGSTKINLDHLASFGDQIIPVGHGELASGLVGDGRMAEPEDIVKYLEEHLGKKKDLADKTVLITAGPTRESIDPVRFISNHSTGKMGIELADECAARGATVHLVLGPSVLTANHSKVNTIKVQSAEDMYQACKKYHEQSDITILAAAVADYTPVHSADQKIKKKEGDMNIELKRTKDIAAELGNQKSSKQIHIGFALETQNAEKNATGKLERKKLDFIVLNTLEDKGAGFGTSSNKVSIIHKSGEINKYELKSKKKVAIDIVNELIQLLK